MKPQKIIRALLITQVSDILPQLELTGDRIRLSRTILCDRYGWIGVPCSELDILIEQDIDQHQYQTVLEVGKKRGRYDGRERTRLAIRERHNMPVDIVGMLRWVERDLSLTLELADVIDGDVLWSAQYRRLRTELRPGGLRDIVAWHWTRYYQMVPGPEMEAIAVRLEADSNDLTITQANRLASRELYAAATAAGWRKLSATRQKRLGLTGQWHHERTILEAYERLQLQRPETTGEWTLDSARGPEDAAIRARPWRADCEAEEAI